MAFLHLQPFIPSGKDFDLARDFFTELGFEVRWDAGGYAGLEKDNCRFILQKYDNQAFAENLMLTVNVTDAASFRQQVIEKKLPERFGIRVGDLTQQPYGLEVNIIDPAGVCWHFVQ